MTWSPDQYLRFEDDRTRPVHDLVAAIPTAAVAHAVDLGCGPGNSTEILLARYPGAAVTGLDSSAEMVAAARKRLPGTRFDIADVATWSPAAPPDVLLANAVLQWVPDHEALLPRLAATLAPGGSLAVQMPENLDEPAHVLMRETAAEPRWAGLLAGAAGARPRMATADGYYRMLRGGCARVDVWRTTYHHVLPGGPDAIVEWFRGSGLRPFLEPLDAADRTAYLDRYRERIAQAYPALPDGSVLLPFPRLFIVATR